MVRYTRSGRIGENPQTLERKGIFMIGEVIIPEQRFSEHLNRDVVLDIFENYEPGLKTLINPGQAKP